MVTAFVLSLDELLFFLGISLTVGYGLSFLLEKYGVPNVVIYIITGFVFSNFLIGTEITEHEQYEFWFLFVETIALGLIGFKIGIEMEFRLLRQQSRLMVILILFEVIGAFTAVFSITYLFTQSALIALILAGLATATAPAATIEVIRRLKSEGPLTQKLKWILAFDDVVAVIVVEAILSFLLIIALGHEVTVVNYLIEVGKEVGLALVIGSIVGYILDVIIESMDKTFQIMELTFANLILVMGIAHTVGTSVILSCMMVGIISVNREGNNFVKAESYLDIILSPILIIFFLLVGGQVRFSDFANPFPILAFLYLGARSIGKISGIFVGGTVAKADDNTRKYLGLGLLPQGGVALGLTTIAADILHRAGLDDIANTILITIVISTVFSEGIGAVTTGYSLSQVDEVGKGKVMFQEISDNF